MGLQKDTGSLLPIRPLALLFTTAEKVCRTAKARPPLSSIVSRFLTGPVVHQRLYPIPVTLLNFFSTKKRESNPSRPIKKKVLIVFGL